MSDYFGKEVPKLGFGLMRLPKKGLHTDIEQVKHMVDLFMEAGFTYFDTTYVYLGSEAAIKKALVDRYPRESFTLATKLNAMMMAPTEKAAKKQFYTSLERTGVGYFDYYLLHAMMEVLPSKLKFLSPAQKRQIKISILIYRLYERAASCGTLSS